MALGLATDQWKRTVPDYIESAGMLATSMATEGFDYAHCVPIDPDGELLDGSHRVACAIALNFKEIPVVPRGRMAWAPAWDLNWFVQHGMPNDELVRLQSDWELMQV